MDKELSRRVKRIEDELSALKTNADYTTSGLSRIVSTTGNWSGNITPQSPSVYRNVCLAVRFTPDIPIGYTPIASLGFKINVSPTTTEYMESQGVWAIPADRGCFDGLNSYVSVNTANNEYVEWYFFFTNTLSSVNRTLSVQFQIISMLTGSVSVRTIR